MSHLFVPGNFECPKCKCGIVAQTIYVKSGTTGSNDKPQICPNDCGPMWKVTWEMRAKSLLESCERLSMENEELKKDKELSNGRSANLAKAALEFYGDEKNYELNYMPRKKMEMPVVDDRGKLARETLKKIRGEP